MATLLLVLVVVLVIGGLVYGVVSLLSGDDPGLVPAEPDGRARPLPNDRSLHEDDLKEVRFDVALRGYRMSQVDRMLRRTAYDLGYKDEMIAVLEAEVAALREGRLEDAELLRKAREAASTPAPADSPAPPAAWAPSPEEPEETVIDVGEVEDGSGEVAGRRGEPDESTVDDAADEAASAEAEAATDRTDEASPDGPDLPREGSLRRRPPLSAVAAEPVAGDALAGTDGTGAIEAADRPAHA